MNDEHPVKDLDNQQPIPGVWRPTFEAVVAALAADNEQALREVPDVDEVSAETLKQIRDEVADYGVTLAPLTEQTWETSVSMWMDTHWHVLVDLQSVEEGPSDLVLTAHVFERPGGYRYEIYMVHVP